MTVNSIDMAQLARFAILPGAADLMRAFSEIPPGPMREAVIHLAMTTAATYTGAPAQRMPDPIGALTEGRQRALPSTRTGREAPGGDPATEAVKMRMAGSTVPEIIAALGITKQQAYQAFYNARKAGLTIPTRGATAPSGPSEPKVWHDTADTLSGQGRRAVEAAAKRRNISIDAYMARRRLALKLAIAGASYDRILKETGETDYKVVSTWLSNARGGGYAVPYVTFVNDLDATPAADPEPVLETTVAPTGRIFPEVTTLAHGAAVAVAKAAERRGMTVRAYQEMRESIVRCRLDGMTPSAIAAQTGQGHQFVKDTCDKAAERGVMFPRLRVEAEPTAPVIAAAE
jgi:hypothetical protein